jgi:hypothetical protein
MALQLIEDGYTLDATVRVPRWPAVVIKYRPALPAAVREFYLATRKAANGDAEVKAIAGILTKHLVGWDIEDNGSPCAVTERAILHVPEPILQRMVDLVTGYGPEEQAADEKNSVTG